jgi:transcriptional regulator with XRE-family HTH domain
VGRDRRRDGVSEPLSARLRRLRLSRGWSQAELARRAGLASQTVCLLESGRRGARPGARVLMALAAALGVEAGELLAPA